MTKRIYILFSLILIIFIVGCGKTNVFEWTKTPTEKGSIELAEGYIDIGEFTKAYKVLTDYLQDHPTDKQGNILYAQTVMGLLEVNVVTILEALTDDSVASNSSVLKLERIINYSDMNEIFGAATIFNNYPPTDTSDKVIAALCGVVAYSQKLREAFDPIGDGILTKVDGSSAEDYSNPDVVSGRWVNMNGDQSTYLNLAINNLASISSDEDLGGAVASMNESLDAVDLVVSNNPTSFTWLAAKTALFD